MPKRTEYVTVMMPKEMKTKIQELAKEKMWTVSQTIYVILCDYFADDGEEEK